MRLIVAVSGARASRTRNSMGSRPCWTAVRSALMIRPWVVAPRQVLFPPQTLRLTTAGLIACSARQLVASTPGWLRSAYDRAHWSVAKVRKSTHGTRHCLGDRNDPPRDWPGLLAPRGTGPRRRRPTALLLTEAQQGGGHGRHRPVVAGRHLGGVVIGGVRDGLSQADAQACCGKLTPIGDGQQRR